MGSELEVDPAVLQQAAQGITGVIDTLTDLGIGETAASGRGFANLALSPMEAGSEEVQKSLEEYAERWTWGIRNLVQSANEIARALDLAAGRYHIMEQQNSDTLKTAWTQVVGNPHLSSEEIENRTWGETFADNPINQTLNSDYSADSFNNAFDHINTNYDVVTEVGPQALANLGVDGTGRDAGYNTGAVEEADSIREGQ